MRKMKKVRLTDIKLLQVYRASELLAKWQQWPF